MNCFKSRDSFRNSKTGLNEGWEDNYRYSVFQPSDNIEELNEEGFPSYIGTHDVALVLFYDRFVPATVAAKDNLVKAARITKRVMSGFASVNCQLHKDLCDQQGVDSLPSFKLYSQGNLVSTIREFNTFTADTMKKYVENCPILVQALPPRRLCNRSEVNPHPKPVVKPPSHLKPIWPKKRR